MCILVILLAFHWWYCLTCNCSRSIQFALTILLVGVGIATVTDLQLNVLGSILSLLAVITTCIAQIVSFWESIYWTAYISYFLYLLLKKENGFFCLFRKSNLVASFNYRSALIGILHCLNLFIEILCTVVLMQLLLNFLHFLCCLSSEILTISSDD